MKLNQVKKKIKLKIDSAILEINCKKLEWNNITEQFGTILEKKINLNQNDILRGEYEELKNVALQIKEKRAGKKLNLIKCWKKVATKYNLVLEPYEKYKIFWTGWYNFYQIDKSKFIQTKNEWKKKCKQIGANMQNYIENTYKYDDLPQLPNEIYADFSNLKIELDFTSKKNKSLM